MSTICAEIVTHNRLSELRRLVEALRQQTRVPDLIIVVDNGSQDSTYEWLACQSDVKTIRQENLGSGGGQYTGIRCGYERGFDWIWCFDDDAMPDSGALASLLGAVDERKDLAVYNSTVIGPDRRFLSFGVVDYSVAPQRTITSYEELSGSYRPFDSLANFFNGTLLPRAIVRSVGLPMPELFIRGDELEYVIRVRSKGFRTYTVPNSIVVHPQEQKTSRQLLCRRHQFALMTPWKRYYSWRNQLFINDEYQFFFHVSDRRLRRIRFVLSLTKELLLWNHPDRETLRAGALALNDWMHHRYRFPSEVTRILQSDGTPCTQ